MTKEQALIIALEAMESGNGIHTTNDEVSQAIDVVVDMLSDIRRQNRKAKTHRSVKDNVDYYNWQNDWDNG